MADSEKKTVKIINKTNSPFGGAYLVTYVGAAIYFVQNASGFWGVVGALIEALFWPGYIVYHVLKLLHA